MARTWGSGAGWGRVDLNGLGSQVECPEWRPDRTSLSLTLVRGRRQVCRRTKARTLHMRRRADVTTAVVACRSWRERFQGVGMHRAHHIVLAGLADAFHSQADSVVIVHKHDELSAEGATWPSVASRATTGRDERRGVMLINHSADHANGRHRIPVYCSSSLDGSRRPRLPLPRLDGHRHHLWSHLLHAPEVSLLPPHASTMPSVPVEVKRPRACGSPPQLRSALPWHPGISIRRQCKDRRPPQYTTTVPF